MTGYSYTASARMPRAAARAAEPRRSRLAGPLLLAACCLVGLAAVWAIAELVPAAHLRDAILLHHFVSLDSGIVHGLADKLPKLLNPVLFAFWGVGLVLLALARGRRRVAFAVAIVMVLAPLSADILKPLLAHPHLHIGWTRVGSASYPSGHSTAAAILVMCAVLVAPSRLRPAVAAIGAAFALAVGVALLIEAWHMPSDVLGGYLLAALWTSLAVAGLRAYERRWPSERSAGTAGSPER